MSVSLARLDGSIILSLSVAFASSKTVAFVRQIVSEKLGVHVNQISLSHFGSELLDDHQQLMEVLNKSASEPVFVVTRPCHARPEEYHKHILIPKDDEDERHGGDIHTYAACVAKGVVFPEPQGININMMPFIIGQGGSLPMEFQQYWPLIEACNIEDAENGKVGFLTIHESMVDSGTSQRRPGLHVEAPRVVMKHGGRMVERFHEWGWSHGEYKVGGLYMGSNISQSARIWNCMLHQPAKVVGIMGDVEHLRDALGEGTLMESGQLWWLTDTTPHESLPLEETACRQYFRVVTSRVSLWYAKHSTANPLGVQPTPAVTRTIMQDKFLQLTDIDSFIRVGEESEELQRRRANEIEEAVEDNELGLVGLFD